MHVVGLVYRPAAYVACVAPFTTAAVGLKEDVERGAADEPAKRAQLVWEVRSIKYGEPWLAYERVVLVERQKLAVVVVAAERAAAICEYAREAGQPFRV